MAETIVIGIFIAVVASLVVYYVFGIGKNKVSKSGTNQVILSSEQKQILNSDNSSLVDNSVTTNITNVYDQKFKEEERVEKAPNESGPQPSEIVAKVNGSPPYQRKSTGDSYAGIKVLWRVKLSSIREYNDILNVLTIYTGRQAGIVIACDVKTADYPRLKVMPENENFYIDGKISEVSSYITLIDARLIFIDD